MRPKRPPIRLKALLLALVQLAYMIIPAAVQANKSMPVTRALLVACQDFFTQPDLSPAASASVFEVARALSMDNNSIQSVFTAVDSIATKEHLSEAIKSAFHGATESDVSLFYIATHGSNNAGLDPMRATISLSNGTVETTLTGHSLEQLLSQVPGIKVVIIDACYSGAMIGKGVDVTTPIVPPAFASPAFKVITSAGGMEPSWFYSNNPASGSTLHSGSYFGTALAAGMGANGQYAADLNRDGMITLNELYRYLLRDHATSTVQVYPQEDDFVLLTYDAFASQTQSQEPLTNITFENDAISFDNPYIAFSFTARRPVRLEYQLVSYRNGAWNWGGITLQMDTHEIAPGSDVSDGVISPGRKERLIEMPSVTESSSGYALFQILSIADDRPTILASRLVPVLPTQGDPRLAITLSPGPFVRTPGNETAIQVSHSFPVRLTLLILDQQQQVVRRLANSQLTRPMPLNTPGSLFYWDGLDQYGRPVPDGIYTVKAIAQVGSVKHSVPFTGLEVVTPPAP